MGKGTGMVYIKNERRVTIEKVPADLVLRLAQIWFFGAIGLSLFAIAMVFGDFAGLWTL